MPGMLHVLLYNVSNALYAVCLTVLARLDVRAFNSKMELQVWLEQSGTLHTVHKVMGFYKQD